MTRTHGAAWIAALPISTARTDMDDEPELSGGIECPVCGCWIAADTDYDDHGTCIRYQCRCGYELRDLVAPWDEYE